MRLALAVLLVCASSASASIVTHDGTPGVVAMCEDGWALDSLGQVWNCNGSAGGWSRNELYDPPVPVEQIRFWQRRWFVTFSGDLWGWYSDQFQNFGPWPDLPLSVPDKATAVSGVSVEPNPSSGPCRVTFTLPVAGPVAVEIVDASGRIVRRLMEGAHPAGDYSLLWNGRDDGGEELPSGVYFTKIGTNGDLRTGRVILAR